MIVQLHCCTYCTVDECKCSLLYCIVLYIHVYAYIYYVCMYVCKTPLMYHTVCIYTQWHSTGVLHIPLSEFTLCCSPTPQASDADSIGVLMTVFGDTVLPHWLAVLSNFPETTNPAVYEDILPNKRYYTYVLYIKEYTYYICMLSADPCIL